MPLEVPLEVPPVLACIQIIQHSAMCLKINIALSFAAYCVSTCSLMLHVFCTTCGSTLSNKYYVYTPLCMYYIASLLSPLVIKMALVRH